MYVSIEELVSDATSKNLPISELVIQAECKDMNVSRNDVWRKMKHNLDTMRLAVSRGAHGIGVYSKTGLTGGDAGKDKRLSQVSQNAIWGYDNVSSTIGYCYK